VVAVSRLRAVIGATLRRRRQSQARTLREVADAAGVSLTYLSEVERGRKEASSEVLEAVCTALGLVLSELLFEVAEELVRLEVRGSLPRIGFVPARPDPLDGQLPRRPASARVPALVAPAGVGRVPAPTGPLTVEPVAARPPVVEPPVPAPVAKVIDLRAYAGRRSA
jgi:XRE family transcriptional regulator, stress-response regulator